MLKMKLTATFLLFFVMACVNAQIAKLMSDTLAGKPIKLLVTLEPYPDQNGGGAIPRTKLGTRSLPLPVGELSVFKDVGR